MVSEPPHGPDADEPRAHDPSPLHAVSGSPGATASDGAVLSMPGLDDPRAVDVHGRTDRYDVGSLPRGTQLGRYVLLGLVGDEPRHGAVYGAYDPDADRRVTLKLFDPGGSDDPDALRRRVAQQAQSLSRLEHPCVERVYEAGVYGPWVFLATEFIEGIDLRHWMEVRDEPFPWPEVLRVFREAGRGLAAAHKLGIVHRDFRPEHVLMGKNGRLVVIDFGLAAQLAEQEDDIDEAELRKSLSGVTPVDPGPLSSSVAGTPAYLAPEQHIAGQATAASDQFGFCVALYEALYGERPFSGNRPRAIALEVAKQNIRPAPPQSNVPAWLRAAVVRGLSARPADRHPSMEALLRELDRDPARRRRRWLRGAAAALAVGALGGLMAVQLERDRSACEDTDDALSEVWTPEQRQAILDAYEHTGRPWASPSWRYTEAKLDAWSHVWRDYTKLACLATRVWGDAEERTYELRKACLDRALSEHRAILGVLQTVDGPMLDRSHLLTQNLPDPRQCTDTAALLALGLPPEDRVEEVAAVQHELATLQARLALGNVESVRRETAELLTRAEATGDAALVARVRLLLGQAQLAAGDPQADAGLHAAAEQALAAGDSGLAAEAWLARMDALVAAGKPAEAVSLGDYVDGVYRNKRFEWMLPRVSMALGRAEWLAEHPVESLAHDYQALEREEARADTDRLRLVPAWLGQARVLAEQDDPDEALTALRTALEVTREALGPSHPAEVEILRLTGRLQRGQGKLPEAREAFASALRILGFVEQPSADLVAELASAVAAIDAAQGELGSAISHYERAFAVLGGPAGASRAETYRVGLELSRAALELGRLARARQVLTVLSTAQPVATATSRGGVTLAERVDAALLLAEATWAGGDHEPARAQITTVLGQLGSDEASPLRERAQQWLDEHPLGVEAVP